jgi:hypothetical protein
LAGQYRTPIPTTYRNRGQIALNLGGPIADGFIVEAQDSQQVKNGMDIVKLAKASASVRTCSAAATASPNEPRTANGTRSRRIEATQNEVKSSMQDHRTGDLAILVSLGGWIVGLRP